MDSETKNIKSFTGIIYLFTVIIIVTLFVFMDVASEFTGKTFVKQGETKTSGLADRISTETRKAFENTRIPLLEQQREAENFTLQFLDGGRGSLADFRGNVVILNFWATWCPPCRAEMPSMEVLYKRFKNQGLEILAVDAGEDTATIRRFIQNNNYTFPVMMDSNTAVTSLYGIEAIPTSFIIDREGKIISVIIGSISWDTPRVIAAFELLLQDM